MSNSCGFSFLTILVTKIGKNSIFIENLAQVCRVPAASTWSGTFFLVSSYLSIPCSLDLVLVLTINLIDLCFVFPVLDFSHTQPKCQLDRTQAG